MADEPAPATGATEQSSTEPAPDPDPGPSGLPDFDAVRTKYLQNLNAHTGRPVVSYTTD